MQNAKPERGLALELWQMIPADGRYERDILHAMVSRWPQARVEKELAWLCERGYLRRCGDKIRPIYVRMSRTVRYSNIAPLTIENVLLQMHQNFEAKESQT